MPAKSLRVTRQAAPIRTQTADNLRAAIMEGRFKPGERLHEKELCRLTGVSRTSVREALRQLEAENLVVSLPHRGPVVAEVTYKEAQEIYQVREQLEGLAARLFTENADEVQLMTLDLEMARLAKALQAGDLAECLRAKKRFYEVLLQGCGNQTVYEILRSLLARINFLRSTSLATPHRLQNSVAEIKRMVAAIQRRDPDAAQEACIEHVRNAAASALPALRSSSQGPRKP